MIAHRASPDMSALSLIIWLVSVSHAHMFTVTSRFHAFIPNFLCNAHCQSCGAGWNGLMFWSIQNKWYEMVNWLILGNICHQIYFWHERRFCCCNIPGVDFRLVWSLRWWYFQRLYRQRWCYRFDLWPTPRYLYIFMEVISYHVISIWKLYYKGIDNDEFRDWTLWIYPHHKVLKL